MVLSASAAPQFSMFNFVPVPGGLLLARLKRSLVSPSSSTIAGGSRDSAAINGGAWPGRAVRAPVFYRRSSLDPIGPRLVPERRTSQVRRRASMGCAGSCSGLSSALPCWWPIRFPPNVLPILMANGGQKWVATGTDRKAPSPKFPLVAGGSCWCPRPDSDRRNRLRRPVLHVGLCRQLIPRGSGRGRRVGACPGRSLRPCQLRPSPLDGHRDERH